MQNNYQIYSPISHHGVKRCQVSMVISYPRTVRWSVFLARMISDSSRVLLSCPVSSFWMASRCQQHRESPHFSMVSDTSHSSDNRPQNRPSTVHTPADVTGKLRLLGISLWPKPITGSFIRESAFKAAVHPKYVHFYHDYFLHVQNVPLPLWFFKLFLCFPHTKKDIIVYNWTIG